MATFNYEFEDVSEKISIESDEIIDEKLNPITDLYIFDVYLAGNGFIANLQYDDFENNKKYIYTKLGTSVSILKKWIKDIKNNMKFKSESYVNDGKTLFSIDSENISIGNLSIKIENFKDSILSFLEDLKKFSSDYKLSK